ncbi:unnamed protein product [Anisakis simplex]|uniref:Uncharacterized protein n=1 Tax=Anisakis simplex TaxID=6269 RepID=A0A0M3JJL3_ANISI|nr:unnamed protein product [Anisakis simplex]
MFLIRRVDIVTAFPWYDSSGAKETFNASTVISDLSTVSCGRDETKWLDLLYTLQFNSTFHCFKIGRLTGYYPVFSVDLGHRIATSFVLLPVIDILIVSSQYKFLSSTDQHEISLFSAVSF